MSAPALTPVLDEQVSADEVSEVSPLDEKRNAYKDAIDGILQEFPNLGLALEDINTLEDGSAYVFIDATAGDFPYDVLLSTGGFYRVDRTVFGENTPVDFNDTVAANFLKIVEDPGFRTSPRMQVAFGSGNGFFKVTAAELGIDPNTVDNTAIKAKLENGILFKDFRDDREPETNLRNALKGARNQAH